MSRDVSIVSVTARTAITPAVWGTTYIVATELLPDGRPLLAACVRALPVGLVFVLWSRQLPTGAWWWRAALLGTLNIGAFFALLFVAAFRLPGGVAATAGAIQPLVAAGIAAVVLGEVFTRRTATAGAAGVAGVAMLVLGPEAALDPIGVAAAIAGTLSMATGVVLTKHWGRPVDLVTFTGWQLSAGGLMLAPIVVFVEGLPPSVTATNVAGFIWLAIGGTGVAYANWFAGIQRLPINIVSFLGLLSPLVATIAGWAVLDQTLTSTQLAGAALVLTAVIAPQIPTHRRAARRTTTCHGVVGKELLSSGLADRTVTRMDSPLAQLSAHDVVAAVELDDPREITVHFADDGRVRCNRYWLRDNCPSNGDRASLFRSFSVARLGDDLSIVDATLHAGGVRVEFSDGASGVFPGSLLRGAVGPSSPGRCWVPWRSGDEPTSIEFDPALAGSMAHHRLLDALDRRGFVIVTGVADEPGATEIMASWLGPIRETDFGRVFDIVTEPDPFTPSQSESALDPHTDDPYRYTPAGVSILHCVTPCAGNGGASTIVDGFAVAEAIATLDPSAFELLATVPIPYAHRREQSVDQGAAVDLRASGPVISRDADGEICGIRFHERAMAPLRLDPDVVDDVYRSLALFSRLVCGGEFAYERRLETGEAIIYDNQRVLHGRSAISGVRSRRHLRLCTVDRDQVHSRLRQLCEQYAPGTEHRPLAAGSRS